MVALICELPLGIDALDVLLHAINLIILVAVLGLLVYKPVRKFMQKRSDDIAANIQKGEDMMREANELRGEYEQKLQSAQDQANAILAENDAKCELERQKVIEMAQKTADDIIAEAKERAEKETADARAEVREEVVGVAFGIASEILAHEISEEDNQKLIDACLAEWEKQHE